MTSEAELQRLAAEYADAQQTLEQVRTDLEQTLERASSEHAAERARLETLVTERDTQLEQQAARHSASQHAAKQRTHANRGWAPPGSGGPSAATVTKSSNFRGHSRLVVRSWRQPEATVKSCGPKPTACRNCRTNLTTVEQRIAGSSSRPRTASVGAVETAHSSTSITRWWPCSAIERPMNCGRWILRPGYSSLGTTCDC